MTDEDIERIKAMLHDRAVERTERIRRWKAEGNQAAIDEELRYCHCPQQVTTDQVKKEWHEVWLRADYNWRVSGWLRDNVIGAFGISEVLPMDDGCTVAFERIEDVINFRLRFDDPKP